ncbi:MAG: RNA repair domain-containing protein [Thermoplasmata archaeon]
MPSAREVLNEFKWRNDTDFNKAEIWYIHRGAPNDTMVLSGNNIVELQRSFMKTKTAMIPYHRIFKITYEDMIVWERR